MKLFKNILLITFLSVGYLVCAQEINLNQTVKLNSTATGTNTDNVLVKDTNNEVKEIDKATLLNGYATEQHVEDNYLHKTNLTAQSVASEVTFNKSIGFNGAIESESVIYNYFNKLLNYDLGFKNGR